MLAAFWSFHVSLQGGSIAFQVTLNPTACHEVNLGRFTVPPESGRPMIYGVTYGGCRHELRSGGEKQLYFAVACAGRPGPWPVAPEKYAVDLSHPSSFRRIDETTWKSAPPLPRSEKGEPPRPDDSGYQVYNGPLLKRSGPSWYGKGLPTPIRTHLSWTMNRAAVNSWDGRDEAGTILDPSWSGRNHIKGHFWIDMYDTASAEPLVRIEGAFDGAEPVHFMGNDASFYSDRYYVIPVGRTKGNGEFGLQQLLVCDLDAASRKEDGSLKQRK